MILNSKRASTGDSVLETLRKHRLYLYGCAGMLVVVLLHYVSAIDLGVSAIFYEPELGKFPARFDSAYHRGVRTLVKLVAWCAGLGVLGAFLWRVVLGRRLFGQSRQTVIYLLLAFALGPGLLTNSILKENWGRARPSQIEAFGGEKQFSRPLTIADHCRSNCSFVSGDASVGFIMVALGFAASTRRYRIAGFAAGLALGSLFSYTRVAQGGHFLSDVVFAALFMMLVAWALHVLILRRDCLALGLMLLRDRA